MKDYYTTLELPPTATQEEIREQYNFLIQAWHPDKFRNPRQKAKAEEKSKEVNAAYSVLKDSARRAEYDRKLAGQPPRVRPAERQRPTQEPQRRKPAEEEPQRPSYERQQQERAEEERRRADDEAYASAPEEWIRVFFEQARLRQSSQPPAKVANSHQVPIRLLLVDDGADTRRHLRKLLSGETEIEVVGEASDSAEAVKRYSTLMPDVAIICINTSASGAITATESIRRKHPLAKVIMISVQNTTSYIRQAMIAGACDYLIKPPRADDLKSAIRLAAGREISASGKAAAK
ncbi:MAG TPA: DnaJ domain-containing protein [Anaerolineales bacterium]|nr:DnaJ domain-containing protein [Anaerolineales bacterium]